jgi:tripartite-type tricarboxylate transporter receptor subunit TctC
VQAPKERIGVIARALSGAMSRPEFQKQLLSQGIQPVANSSPEQARAFVAAEVARWRPIAEKLGIEM